MWLRVCDTSVNVNGIYYVHVCERARWARSAGNSAIEKLCCIIIWRYSRLSSRLIALTCDSTRVTSFLYSAFLNIHRSGVLTALTWLVPHETAAVSARSVYTIQPCAMSLHAKPHTQGACVFSCNLLLLFFNVRVCYAIYVIVLVWIEMFVYRYFACWLNLMSCTFLICWKMLDLWVYVLTRVIGRVDCFGVCVPSRLKDKVLCVLQ